MRGTSTTHTWSWPRLLGALAALLALVGSLSTAVAAPADAATDCSDQGAFELRRLLVEFGGTEDGTLDGTGYLDSDVDAWCYSNNDIIFTGHEPSLHISCSEDLTGITVSGPGVPGGSAVITEFWMDSRNPANDKSDRELCQDESTFPEPEPEPDISLTKVSVVGAGSDLVDGGEGNDYLVFSPGDDEGPKTALYSYVITNTGDEALTGIGLKDDLVDSGDLDVSDCAGTLAVGDSCTATGTDLFGIGDAPGQVTNRATATGVGEQSQQEVADLDDETIDLLVGDVPAITLVKSSVVGAGSDLLDGGEGNDYLVFSPGDDEGPKTALYSYVITNTGDEALSLQSLSDDRIGSIDLSGCDSPLAVGATCTVTSTEDFTVGDAPAADVTNTAMVAALGVQSETKVQDVDDAVIDLRVTYAPAISLVKSTVVGESSDLVEGGEDNDFLFWGEDATAPQIALYGYTITNTGDEPLIDLQLVDDRAAIGAIDLSDCPEVLDVGDDCTVFADESFELPGSAAQVTNTAVVAGTGQDSGDDVSSEDAATIDLSTVLPRVIEAIEIDLEKSVVLGAGDVDDEGVVTWSRDEFKAGDDKTVVYRFTVTNVGEATIVDVELTDPMISDEPIIAVEDGVTLEPGESTSVDVEYALTFGQAFPDGEAVASKIDNVAAVSGANVTRDAFSEDGDDVSVTTQVVFDEVVELPATGLQRGLLLPLGMLLAGLGAAILWVERRRRRLA